ncbi:hypothetical protein [Thiothrix sp.]|jgi:hypothetical protein|uniref:hypothetical protein n=1 Tax=Thiothrix sp. TaxID=1032 RepID=UPI00257A3CDD|nr:hypothetical protein [Thiothrix sp.]
MSDSIKVSLEELDNIIGLFQSLESMQTTAEQKARSEVLGNALFALVPPDILMMGAGLATIEALRMEVKV